MLENLKRREKIAEMLQASDVALTGAKLAAKLETSRQAIVHDIALLRASGVNIIATTHGYIIPKETTLKVYTRVITCKHSVTDLFEELSIIIDQGGRVRDVAVNHKVYGEIKGDLVIKSPLDIRNFINKMKEGNAGALSSLTDGIHTHTIEADTEEALDVIESMLECKGFLKVN